MKELNYVGLLKELRRRRGLTQEEVAHKLGVTFATVDAWENGRRRPMPFLARRLVEIAARAGVDVATFRLDEGEEDG
jgi:transcriptional regulator with XRE-family HTH domain